VKKFDSFLSKAALKYLLRQLEKQERRVLPHDAPRTRLNVLNSGLMLDLDAARKIAILQTIELIRKLT
jgi:hypothetical protein